jgi:hypothetical protein
LQTKLIRVLNLFTNTPMQKESSGANNFFYYRCYSNQLKRQAIEYVFYGSVKRYKT